MESPPVCRVRRVVSRFCLLLTVAAVSLGNASVLWAAAALNVVPNANFDVDGDGNNAIPFGDDQFCDDGIRYQQLYPGDEVGGPNIGSMAFRLDASESDVGGVILEDVTVTLSSTLATRTTLSARFEDNIGPDAQVVYTGDVLAELTTSGSGTNPFDLYIDFDTPFEFDGSNANLLVDVVIRQCEDMKTFSLDSVNTHPVLSRVWSPDKDNEIAYGGEDDAVDSVGLVTEFYIFSDGVVYVPYVMGAGGNWAVDGHNGEGFLFEPLGGGLVVVFWFTYDLFGNPMWMIGVADTLDFADDPLTGENVGTVDMYRTQGPVFGPDFDPADYQETYMGPVTFRLNGCLASEGATGEVQYNFDFGFGSGTYTITKLYDIYKNDCGPSAAPVVIQH
ncbi:hypothetical protein [Elongatibacter sediminis]|uniref:Uncharacterized protein n=1 Tax=Elongatibacter sediminis TaxID=3119006 RepID=A0AAW9RBW5_9GAMM